MQEVKQLIVPECEICGSHQIRTTKEYRVCIRCGHKVKLE